MTDTARSLSRACRQKQPEQEAAQTEAAPAAVSETLSAVDAVLSEAERTVRQQKPARGRTRGRATRATPSSSGLVTPLQPPRPLHASTPAVTPKFDPRTVQQQAPSTIRRHRPREVLMSLKGSPVMLPDGAEPPPAAEAKQLVVGGQRGEEGEERAGMGDGAECWEGDALLFPCAVIGVDGTGAGTSRIK